MEKKKVSSKTIGIKGEIELEIQKSKEKGRFIVCCEDTPANTLVFKGIPYSFAIFDNYKKRVCDWCCGYFHLSHLPFSCSKCHQAWFCSQQCFEISHKVSSPLNHQNFCEFYRQLLSCKKIGTKDTLSVLKLLFKILVRKEWEQQSKLNLTSETSIFNEIVQRKHFVSEVRNSIQNSLQKIEDDSNSLALERKLEEVVIEQKIEINENSFSEPNSKEEVGILFPNAIFTERDIPLYSDVEQLISHTDKWSSDDYNDWRKLAHLFSSLVESHLSENEIYCLLSQIESNGFGMWTLKSHQCYGRILCPTASFFNHSCDPNCSVYFTGSCIFISNKKEIKKGEELSIGYIDLIKPRATRRSILSSEYKFSCECARCEQEKDQPTQKITYEKSKAKHGPKKAKLKKKKEEAKPNSSNLLNEFNIYAIEKWK